MGGPWSTRWARHPTAPIVEDAEAIGAEVCLVCRRRVRALYRPAGEPLFACRLCHGLTYRSSQQSHRWDAAAAEASRRMGMAVSSRELREALGEQAEVYLRLLRRRADRPC